MTDKTVHVLIVTFPDPESGEGGEFEQVVSSHASHEAAVKAGDLYASPFHVIEVHHYE